MEEAKGNLKTEERKYQLGEDMLDGESKMKTCKELVGFKDWEFSSGSTTGEDFKVFARLFKKFIKVNLPESSELVGFSKGHYFLFGFVKKNEKFVYFSISDVRFFSNEWVNNILIRTAKSEKDYTGGGNGWTSLVNFRESVDNLFDRQEE